ncbi:MAG: hypothetical protein J6B29_02460 [Clostridia bacterium]|nr:hypothetical protein [Clostridia bacterium]
MKKLKLLAILSAVAIMALSIIACGPSEDGDKDKAPTIKSYTDPSTGEPIIVFPDDEF